MGASAFLCDAPVSFKKKEDGFRFSVIFPDSHRLSLFVQDDGSVSAGGDVQKINDSVLSELQGMPFGKFDIKRVRSLHPGGANFISLSSSLFSFSVGAEKIRPVAPMPVPLFPDYSVDMSFDPVVLGAMYAMYGKGSPGEKVLAMEAARAYSVATFSNRKLHIFAVLTAVETLLEELGENLFSSFSKTVQSDIGTFHFNGRLDKNLVFHLDIVLMRGQDMYVLTNDNGEIDPFVIPELYGDIHGIPRSELSLRKASGPKSQLRHKDSTWILEKRTGGENRSVGVFILEDPKEFFVDGRSYFFDPLVMSIEEVYPPSEACETIASEVKRVISSPLM